MKRLIVAVSVVLAFVSVSFAQEPAKAPVKIGVVNLQRLLNESDYGKFAKGAIEEAFKQKQAVIERKVKDKDKLAKDLEKQAMALSDDERRKRAEELDAVERAIDHMVSDAEKDMQKLDRQKKEEFLKAVDQIIERMGKEDGYAMILPTDAVVYVEDSLDITNTVMSIYNEAYKRKLEKDKSGDPAPAPDKDSGGKKKGK